MRKSTLLKALAPTLVLFSTQAAALPFQSIDPRSLAMGGVGVASGSSANAAFMNPALLSVAGEDEDFSLELPILGARFSDPDSLLDEIDTYQDSNLEANLTTAVNDFNAAFAAANVPLAITEAGNVATATRAVQTQLMKIDNKPIQGEVFGGMVIGIPSKKVGASLNLDAYVVAGGVFDYTTGAGSDDAMLQGIITAADAVATLSDPTQLSGDSFVAAQGTGTDVVSNLTSNLGVRGAVISEVGLSLSREVNIGGHDIAVGVTPKVVKVKTFHYILDANTADLDSDKGTKEYSDFNIDVGLAKDYGNGWKAGLVVKNLIGKEYETSPFASPGLTVTPATIKVDPQVRLGVSHANEWLTLAADLDVTENEPVGFESKTQYLGLGAEMDLLDWVQFRAGYRHNLSDSDTSIPTIGFGFSPFGVHMDLALAGNGDEVAASFQLGFRF